MLTLLIDADVLRYQLAFKNTSNIDWNGDGDVSEATNPEKAKVDLEDYIAELMDKFGADDFVLPLSVDTNFRKGVYPDYKSNRKGKPKPSLWYEIDTYLQELWGDKIVTRDQLEGDDILGLLATHPKPRLAPGRRILVSIDKDMQTIPCRLYNPGKPDIGVRTISRHDADLFWMKQVLMGDTADGYPGCKGIGPKKADELLMPVHEQHADSEPEDHLSALWEAVVAGYESKNRTVEDAITQARLARILRHGDYNFRTEEICLWAPGTG